MQILDMHKKIMDNDLDNFYIFIGSEVKAMDIYIEQISKVKGLDVSRVDEIGDIFGSLRKVSLIQKNYLYVIRTDSKTLNNLKNIDKIGLSIGKNMLIYLVDSVDKRSKIAHMDNVVFFEPLEDVILKKYIAKELDDMSDSAMNYLIDVCEHDFSTILLELDKIKNYMASEQIIYATEALRELVNQGAIFEPPQDVVYDYIEAVMRHQSKKAFELLEECKRYNENTLSVIALLYNNVKRVLQVQACESKNVAESCGIPSNQVWAFKKLCGVYSNGTLVYMLRTIRDVECMMKRGEIPSELVLDYLTVMLL